MTPENRLGRETSPYLLQHARDPVDWHPWGDEAFDRARREDKPVFLSIGYSTCHWCHVMARESFADPDVAALLNEGFVAVKVDREERPDLDHRYMAVCQSLTGSGGWPLTVVTAPDGRPFFAGTYFPRSRRWGRPGLLELLPALAEAWRTRREEVLRSAGEIAAAVERSRANAAADSGARLTEATLDEAFRGLAADFDRERGGFGRAPKFPIAHHIGFLLRYWRRTGVAEALGMAGRTLKAMRRGGIYDHLGFGFHRYATDADWLVPHFEKMLTDQALLAEVYAEAFAATGRAEFRQTAAEIADYVLRELRLPEGGFATAEDADSEGEEGLFYLWTRAEVEQVLGPEEGRVAALAFHVGESRSPAGLPDGRTVLHDGRAPNREAVEAGTTASRVDAIRRKLLLARDGRPRPFKDTKVLADGNGLMIAGLAAVYEVTGEARVLRAAEAAADFVLAKMRGPDGRLRHVFAGGEARVPGFLDDHSFMIKGLIALYGAGYEPGRLEAALELVDRAVALFWDEAAGGFFFDDGGDRAKEIYDGAVPSGNSVMFMNLLRLARLTGRDDLEARADRLAAAFAAEIGTQPRLSTEFLRGLDYALGPSREVVVVGEAGAADTRALLAAVRDACLRDVAVLFKPAGGGATAAAVERLAPFTKGMDAGGGPAAAYVCTEAACGRPVLSPADLLEALRVPPPVTAARRRIPRSARGS